MVKILVARCAADVCAAEPLDERVRVDDTSPLAP